MRQLKIFWLFLLPLLLAGSSFAQDVRILYPQANEDVRGEITARFEGIPAGGYASIKINDAFSQATAQDYVVLDTITDRATFKSGDGSYTMEVTVFNSGGKRVGTATVTFNVANNKVDVAGQSVRLVHWQASDRLGNVQRYRVFAESNATITGGMAAGAAGAAPAGGAAEAAAIPAPLDWQVAVLLRRMVRDVGMYNGSANISTIVQEGFERQREGEGAGGATAAPAAAAKPGAAPAKAPWTKDWNPASETGKLLTKMIQQNGTEINPTRKSGSLAVADLLPTFPDVPVRPGSTWETTMSLVGDLSSRLPINVRAPITFTAFEDLQTPAGESLRCAKLESRFRLPENLAKRIAANLANKSGAAGAGAGAAAAPASAGAAGGSEAGATLLTEADIEKARTDMARVLWFDITNRRVLRAEDTILSNFEIPTLAPAGAPAGAGDAGAAAAPVEPTVVNYNLKVTTWVDDRVPNPTGQYVPGGVRAHTRDSVTETGLSRILR